MKISNVLISLSAMTVFQLLGLVGAIASPLPPNTAQSADAAPLTTAQSAPTETEPVTYSVFMLVKTTNAWLQLSPEERFAFLNSDINPILAQNPTVKMSFFDTEGFNSRVTDVIVWQAEDLEAYQGVVEALRESDFWGTYFEVVEILPGIENAYARYYDVEAY